MSEGAPTHDVLAGFGPATRRWFTDCFDGPTAVQSGGWTERSGRAFERTVQGQTIRTWKPTVTTFLDTVSAIMKFDHVLSSTDDHVLVNMELDLAGRILADAVGGTLEQFDLFADVKPITKDLAFSTPFRRQANQSEGPLAITYGKKSNGKYRCQYMTRERIANVANAVTQAVAPAASITRRLARFRQAVANTGMCVAPRSRKNGNSSPR